MRLLVCGGRDFLNWKLLKNTLDKIHAETPLECLMHGGSRGADSLAGLWARKNSIFVYVYDAEWRKYGPDADFRRNAFIIEDGKPDLLVAFPGGDTADLIWKATHARVLVLVVRDPPGEIPMNDEHWPDEKLEAEILGMCSRIDEHSQNIDLKHLSEILNRSFHQMRHLRQRLAQERAKVAKALALTDTGSLEFQEAFHTLATDERAGIPHYRIVEKIRETLQ